MVLCAMFLDIIELWISVWPFFHRRADKQTESDLDKPAEDRSAKI